MQRLMIILGLAVLCGLWLATSPLLAQVIVVPVECDLKPGSDRNPVNPKSKGVIPVAILSTSTFDATTVDPLSVTFGPGDATETHDQGHLVDVDGDSDLDMVLHFRTQEAEIECGDTVTGLTGQTTADVDIACEVTFVTVGCKKP